MWLEKELDHTKTILGYPCTKNSDNKWDAFEWSGEMINDIPLVEKELREYLKEY